MIKLLKLEMKRQLNPQTIVFTVFFLAILIFVLQFSIFSYKSNIEKSQSIFKDFENSKMERYTNYSQYGKYGFRLLAQPSTLSPIFGNSSSFGHLLAFMDSGVRMELLNPKFGSIIFEKPTGGELDISMIFLLIGSLFAIYWGANQSVKFNYIKYLLNFNNKLSVFLSIFLSKLLLLLLIMFTVFLCFNFQFFLNGISLSTTQLLGLLFFILINYLVMIFFLAIGLSFFLLGRTKKILKALLFWFLIVIIFPGVLSLLFLNHAENSLLPIYQYEKKKMTILRNFEKKSELYLRQLNNKSDFSNAQKELSELYMNNELKEIEKIDLGLISKSKALARKFHFWSIFNPVTFFKSVNNELSSRGFNEYHRFYSHLQSKHRGFLRYYFDKRFYEQDPIVRPYLKENEYIFPLRSSLPGYFGAGLLLNLFYLFLLMGLSYYRFNRLIYYTPKEKTPFIKLKLFSEKTTVCLTFSNELKQAIYSYFSGKNNYFDESISLNDEKPVKEKAVYLCHPENIPGWIKIKDFLNLVPVGSKEKKPKLQEKYFHQLSIIGQIELMIYLVKSVGRTLFIVDEIERDSTPDQYEKLIEIINELKKGGVILYLTKNLFFTGQICDIWEAPKGTVPQRLTQ